MLYYMLMTVLIPFVILFAGWAMKKHPPKWINGWFGYRTKRSMRNQETWNFAQRYCGKIWMRLGLFLLISSALVCVAYLFVTEDNWYIVMLAADGIQVVLLLATIVPIERALQKNFDSNGTKRTSEVK